jgi:hypothetical protein
MKQSGVGGQEAFRFFSEPKNVSLQSEKPRTPE